jgi:probable rRNA maturation factor
MTFHVGLQNDNEYALDEHWLRRAAEAVLTQQRAQPESTLTIVVTDNESVAVFNRQYRGVDAPTDVLSFPADEPPVEIPDEPPYLGDLIIAYPYAAAQAEREHHALGDSLALLVVHGTLHLLGYDHDTSENRAAMWEAQATALDGLGVSRDIVPSLESKADDHTL